MATLNHDLEKTGSGGPSSVDALTSMPTHETVLQVDQQLPPSTSEIHASDYDLEKSGIGDSVKGPILICLPETETVDIEHVSVQNDPRKWSSFRKVSFPTWS
jgi:hypothetical protein